MNQSTLQKRNASAKTVTKKKLPASWYKAAGMMKHKKRDLERYIHAVRKEWD